MIHLKRHWRVGRLLPLAALLLAFACGEDDKEETTRAWGGTLRAKVDGVVTEFTEVVWMEEINGGDAWVIGNAGDQQLQFYVASAAPGSYPANPTSTVGMGRYVPDTGVPGYDYNNPEGEYNTNFPGAGGTITLTSASSTGLVGTFSFVVKNGAGDSVEITEGQIDLHFGPPVEADSPVGLWQRTTSGVEQETLEIVSGGALHRVHANYGLEACSSADGTWSLVGDSLRLVLEDTPTTFAWSLAGGTLQLWNAVQPEPRTFQAASSLPSCEDYGFQTADTGWTGTLSATVDGVAVEFEQSLWLETIAGGDAWVIGNAGNRQIQFYIATTAPGTYPTDPTSEVGMGRYVPDTSVPGYDYANPAGEYNTNVPGASGSITITSASATHLTGTFSFVAGNGTGGSVTLTNGVVDIQAVVEASPAGTWQTGEEGAFLETLRLADGGAFTQVVADWQEGGCETRTSVWAHNATHIFTGTGLNRVPLGAWTLSEGLLTLDRGDGDVRTYHSVDGLPSCDDYSFDPLEAVYGYWQRGMEGMFEETVAILQDHQFQVTVALIDELDCFVVDGEWAWDGDSLRVEYVNGNGPPAFHLQVSGGSLVMQAPGDGDMHYQRVDTMPDCEDYGFETGVPVGIWQDSQPDVLEYTLEFAAGGEFGRTYAYFVDSWCYEEAGTWTATADSLHIEYPGSQESLAYERMGNSLTITFPDGNWVVLMLTGTMPGCADYGLGGSPPAPGEGDRPLTRWGAVPAHGRRPSFTRD